MCTFGYISVLSVVGERLATRLRSALFDSILQQVHIRCTHTIIDGLIPFSIPKHMLRICVSLMSIKLVK